MQPARPDAPAELGDGGLDAFISYSRRDAATVLPFVRAANARGRQLWLDNDDIPPGAPWRAELGTALEAANAVVCCLSPAWMQSVECRREYDRALELGKRLVPVLISDIDDAPPDLRPLQWINAKGGRGGSEVADAVLRAIDVDHALVREHTHWLSRALRWEAKSYDRSLLLRGRELKAAELWLALPRSAPLPTPLQTRLVVQSRQAERRRLRTTVGASITATVVSLTLAVVALLARNEAENQRRQADSRALAAAAVAQLDVDPERSVLLAREAWDRAPTPQAVSALRTSIQRSRVRLSVPAHDPTTGSVSGVAWSSDGQTLLSTGRDGALTAWDAVSGTERGRLQLDASAVSVLATAASSGGGVAVSENGRAVLWQLDPVGHRLRQRTVLAERDARSAATSSDGRVIATGMADGTIRTWTADGRLARILSWNMAGPVEAVAVSADGRMLVAGSTSGIVMAGPADGRGRAARLHRYAESVTTVQVSADGKVALTAAEGGTGSVRRTTDGRLVLAVPSVFKAALDPLGRFVAAGDISGRVNLLAPGRSAQQLVDPGAPALDIRFSTDGTRLAVFQFEGVARIWSVPGFAAVADVRGHSATMTRGTFSPDGRRLLTGYGDGRLQVWEMPEQPPSLDLFRATDPMAGFDGGQTASVDFSPDGGTILTASRDGRARLWDARTRQERRTDSRCTESLADAGCLPGRTLAAHGSRLTQASYTPDGKKIITSAENGTVFVWDSITGLMTGRFVAGQKFISAFDVTRDGSSLATGSRDGLARLIDLGSGRPVTELRSSDTDIVDVAFSSDGADLVTLSFEGTARLWDVERHTSRLLAEGLQGALAVAVDRSGESIAVAMYNKIVRIAISDGQRIVSLSGHAGLVTAVAFTPDGSLIVSGGMDGTVRVWDAGSGDQAAEFRTPRGYVTEVAIDPSGRRIAAAATGGAAYVFDCAVCRGGPELAQLAAERVTRELTGEERGRFGL